MTGNANVGFSWHPDLAVDKIGAGWRLGSGCKLEVAPAPAPVQ